MSIIHQRAAFVCGLLLAVLCLSAPLGAQKNSEDTDHTYRPLKLKLDEKGDKYVRFILWHQMWATTNNLAGGSNKVQLTPSIRRSRILAYAQISPRFLLLTHFGLNGLTPSNLTTLGSNGDAPQFFLHGAWTEFRVSQDNSLYLGAGLHYWNGLTRLSSASTLNFMTLDQPRPFAPWHSLGYGDQFARHLGVYAKGQLGKLDYRLSVNSPSRASLNDGVSYAALSNITYNGVLQADVDNLPTGNGIYQGYVQYNLWDAEGTKLPYNVGTYLGKKKVFALGGGFYLHPNGAFDNTEGQEGHVDVGHFAVDAFMDLPTKGGCFNAYASVMNFDYGENFVGRWAGTGTAVYGQVGYFLRTAKIMPYFAYQMGNYDGFEENMTSFNAGINYFLNGHNAKLTLEFHRINNDLTTTRGDVSQLRMQAHVFL